MTENTQTLEKLCCLRLLLRVTINFAAYRLRDNKICLLQVERRSTSVLQTKTLVFFQQSINAIFAYLCLS